MWFADALKTRFVGRRPGGYPCLREAAVQRLALLGKQMLHCVKRSIRAIHLVRDLPQKGLLIKMIELVSIHPTRHHELEGIMKQRPKIP